MKDGAKAPEAETCAFKQYASNNIRGTEYSIQVVIYEERGTACITLI